LQAWQVTLSPVVHSLISEATTAHPKFEELSLEEVKSIDSFAINRDDSTCGLASYQPIFDKLEAMEDKNEYDQSYYKEQSEIREAKMAALLDDIERRMRLKPELADSNSEDEPETADDGELLSLLQSEQSSPIQSPRRPERRLWIH
jgi:hypothetical protein